MIGKAETGMDPSQSGTIEESKLMLNPVLSGVCPPIPEALPGSLPVCAPLSTCQHVGSTCEGRRDEITRETWRRKGSPKQ
jgi:hypothetical protein